MWREFYTTKRMKNFSQFLAGVKYAFLKIYGDLDTLTMQKHGSEKTLWNELKETGKYEYNKDGEAIDLEFGRCIYVSIKNY